MRNTILMKYTDHRNFKQMILDVFNDFNSNTKTILFIEPYGSALSLLKLGIASGFNIIILTAHSDLRIVSSAILQSVQLSIQIDTIHDSTMLQLMSMLRDRIKIDAVIPGFEYFVPIAATISNYLGLPGIGVDHVMQLRDKGLMRLTLANAGIAIPQFYIVNSITELANAIECIGFPAVCKPIDAAGSVNVKKVNSKREAFMAATRILAGNDVLWGYKLSNKVLYEEYVDGMEYSLEGIVTHGNIIHFSITEKFVFDQLEFIEVGHIVNPPIHSVLKNKMEKYVEKVMAVLKPNHCPFHAEIRINKEGEPILMEIAARLAGDKIGDLINLSKHINYFDYVYAAYMGDLKFREHSEVEDVCAGIQFFYRPTIDTYTRVSGLEESKQYPIEDISLYYQPNQDIPVFPKPLRRLGHVMMKNNDYAQLLSTLQLIDKNIVFYP